MTALGSGSSIPQMMMWEEAAAGFAPLGVGWLVMLLGGQQAFVLLRVPALGSVYKYSKLCTGWTHAASVGNSSDPLREGRRR